MPPPCYPVILQHMGPLCAERPSLNTVEVSENLCFLRGRLTDIPFVVFLLFPQLQVDLFKAEASGCVPESC